MNYKKIYQNIIDKRKLETPESYTETHHILPKSLGGSDEPENLVKLTAREHFICHYLLAKMFNKETNEWYKMNHAFMMMKCQSICNKRYFNSRLYDALRTNFSSMMSIIQTGKNNSQYGTIWICNTELKENKKIRKDDTIPEGWIKGRNLWKTPKPRKTNTHCKYCGSEKCTYPNICKKVGIIKTFVDVFGLDVKIFGSQYFYVVYSEIVENLKKMYYEDKLSTIEIGNKYNISNQRVWSIFRSLGIKTRNNSEAWYNHTNKNF